MTTPTAPVTIIAPTSAPKYGTPLMLTIAMPRKAPIMYTSPCAKWTMSSPEKMSEMPSATSP